LICLKRLHDPISSNSRVHIETSNHSDIASYVKTSVDKSFGITTALDILYIKPDDGHIGFGRDLDYIGSQC